MRGIVLIGLSGSGKSSVGRPLAKALQMECFDTDQWIEEQSGTSIHHIFSQRGEEVFRQWEKKALAALPRRCVLSTGGGLPYYHELPKGFFVVYLYAQPDELFERIAQGSRPLIQNLEDLQEQFSLRDPLYRNLADLQIKFQGRSPEQLTQEILVSFKERLCYDKNDKTLNDNRR